MIITDDKLLKKQARPLNKIALVHPRLNMNKYEILSIEPSDLAHYWVVSFVIDGGEIDKEVIEALDSYEAFIKFRNKMIILEKMSVKKVKNR